MNAKAEIASSGADTAKLILALVVLVGGLVGLFVYSDQINQAVRVVSMLAVIGVAAAIAAFTVKGRRFINFMQDASIEVRKVVWPTRQETVQTTIVIIIMVSILGILLWFIDVLLAGGVRMLLGR